MNTDRIERVNRIIAQHVPFEEAPFQPRPITTRVFRTPSGWIGRKMRLHPVAFKVRINVIECMGCITSSGGMSPYLWVDPAKRLVGRVGTKHVFVDPDSLTEEDIANLELGVKGDGSLLDDEYHRIEQDVIKSL